MHQIIPFILPSIFLVIATIMVIYCWILDWRIMKKEEELKDLVMELALKRLKYQNKAPLK